MKIRDQCVIVFPFRIKPPFVSDPLPTSHLLLESQVLDLDAHQRLPANRSVALEHSRLDRIDCSEKEEGKVVWLSTFSLIEVRK